METQNGGENASAPALISILPIRDGNRGGLFYLNLNNAISILPIRDGNSIHSA